MESKISQTNSCGRVEFSKTDADCVNGSTGIKSMGKESLREEKTGEQPDKGESRVSSFPVASNGSAGWIQVYIRKKKFSLYPVISVPVIVPNHCD